MTRRIAVIGAGAAGLWVCEIDLMRGAMAKERARIARLYPDSPRYGLELDPAEYRKALARERRRGAARAHAGADA